MNSSKDKVRLGIIGMGNMGKYHADYLLKGKIDRCQLVAVCDANIDSLEHYRPLTISNNGTQLLVFAGMFQLRAEPRYLKIRKLIKDVHSSVRPAKRERDGVFIVVGTNGWNCQWTARREKRD